MRLRALFLAFPATLAAAAGLAYVVSANAIASDADLISDSDALIAQAPPPAAVGGAGGQRERPAFSPRAMCQEQIARRIGNRAYLKARLDLKPEQMTVWSTFEKAADEASAKQRARCAAMPTEIKTPLGLVDRVNWREDAMKSRLESIEAVKPSLLALYGALTPEQKAVLDRPRMGGFGGDRGMRGPEPGPR